MECSGIIDHISEGVDEAWLGRAFVRYFQVGGSRNMLSARPRLLRLFPRVLNLLSAWSLRDLVYRIAQSVGSGVTMVLKDKVPIHAGASGVGIVAIQLAHFWAVLYITCGSQTKLTIVSQAPPKPAC